jgi:hypothetical protein
VSSGTELAVGPIRVAPDAAVIATTLEILPVRVVGTHGAWSEIEVHVPRARVHGFVPAVAVTTPAELHVLGGVGHGGGYGISDTKEVDVPTGACLYDKVGGDVVGVEVAPKRRYSGGMTEPGWWHAYVGNAWGLMSVWLRGDPKTGWEMCTK